MTARKKTIKKPSFVITYVISLLIVSPFLIGVVGLLLYNSERTKYYSRVGANLSQNYSDIENYIFDYLAEDKEKITPSETVWLKWTLVCHYSETGQYIEVYKNKELVADAKQTVMLTYNQCSGDQTVGYNINNYKLEIADKKFMEYFKTPEADLYYYCDNVNDGYEGSIEGFNKQPYLEFVCSEFYADLENSKFVPVAVKICHHANISDSTGSYNVRITPDPKDIEGFTLIKIGEQDEAGMGDSARGTMDGLEGQLYKELNDGGSWNLERTNYFRLTELSVKDFEVVYGYDIINILMVFVLGSFVFALVPATIRYNINKRNYEIFQYRLKTTNAMAHDLKTPLAAIAGYAESLSYHIGTDKQEYYADQIEDKVSQMTLMINNILEFSKSEALTGKVTTSDTEIGSVIAEIIADNEQTISSRNLKVNYDQKEVVVKTDKEIFKQALANLIGNAVLHSKDGTEIDISCDKGSVVIVNTVSEKIDDIKSIREPFVKGSESRGNNGSGLGLAIADNNLAMLKYKLELKTEGDKFYAVVKL